MAVTYEKISDMTAASALDGTELFEAVQSSASVKATGSQLNTYVHANPTAGVTGTTAITGEHISDAGSELDYSASVTNGMAAATLTITELPSTTQAIWVNIQADDTSTQCYMNFLRASGGTVTYSINATFADAGTNRLRGTYWLPTENNTIYISAVNADATSQFIVIGYKTG